MEKLILVWSASRECYALVDDSDTVVKEYRGPGCLADIEPKAEAYAKKMCCELEVVKWEEVE